MAQKDMTSKTLEGYNDVFADIVNVFLFQGRQIIIPEELTQADTFSHYKANGKFHSQERDVSKNWMNKNYIQLAFFGIENQASYYKFMPVRVIGYDGAAYRSQLLNNEKLPERIYPVVTIVINFGADKWKNKTLYECMDIPEILKPYVNDYKINLFDIKDLTYEQVCMFRSDFKHIAIYFYRLYHGGEYIGSDERLKHPQEVIDFFSVFRKDNRFLEAYNELIADEEAKVTMCELLDKIEARGFDDGKKIGFDDGKKIGFDDGKRENTKRIVFRMLKKNSSDAEIIDLTEISEKELSELKEEYAKRS